MVSYGEQLWYFYSAFLCMQLTNILFVLAAIGFKYIIMSGMSVASVLITRNLTIIGVALVILKG